MTKYAAAIAAFLFTAGCATQAEREAAVAEARAEWQACVDEQIETAYQMARVFDGTPGMEAAIGVTTGRIIAQECGTGGLDSASRTAYILARARELESARQKESPAD